MSKVELHKLGEYIREVDVRNHDLQCKNLLGLSIAKEFIPSIANIIGTDLRSYKIVKNDQFAYVPVTSRNGEKITVAHYCDKDNCIISQAYTVFEVFRKDELLPDYLMLWFRRPEFDRYARYMSHGSAREVFDWDEMSDTMLPIPSIEDQCKIVNQYNAIQNRIELNKQTIAKLEDAAQAIYRKMFIEDIDPENLPDGWRKGKLCDVAIEVSKRLKGSKESYSYYLPIDLIPRKSLVYKETYEVSYAESSLVTFEPGDIIFGAIRPYFHKIVIARERGITRSTCMVINSKLPTLRDYLSLLLFQDSTVQYATNNSIGTTMPYVTWDILAEMEIIIPDSITCRTFSSLFEPIKEHLFSLIKEQKRLCDLRDIYLSNL